MDNDKGMLNNFSEVASFHDILSDKLLVHGRWIAATVDQGVGWPTQVTEICFRGHEFILIPKTLEYRPAIALRVSESTSFEDGQRLVSDFLSRMAWAVDRQLSVVNWSSGGLPRLVGELKGASIVSKNFRLNEIPETNDPDALLALALYREGLGLSHEGYACLSFFRVINLVAGRHSKDTKNWIAGHLPDVRSPSARGRLVALQHLQPNQVAEQLYETNRCAMAHAGHGTTMNPDNPSDWKRVRDDLPLVRALAAVAIEAELRVKSGTTLYREHLYELAGFKKQLGPEIVDALVRDVDVDASNIKLPSMSVGLLGQQQKPALADLEIRSLSAAPGGLIIDLASPNDRCSFKIGLDFAQERLRFNPYNSPAVVDDGSVSAVETAIEVAAFRRDLIGNGELVIIATDSNERLGRCDAFMPLNIDPGATFEAMNRHIGELEKLAAQRRQQSENTSVNPPD